MATKTKQTPNVVRDYLRARENSKVARARYADMEAAYNGAAGSLREHLIDIFEANGLSVDNVLALFNTDVPF